MSKKEKEKQSKIFDGAVKEFETRCQNLSHFCCKVCMMTGIRIKPSCCNPLICTTCQAQKATIDEKMYSLPIWNDENGVVHYELPEELKFLQEGEKLLIQKIAPYIPLLHLKDGQLASRGHICSFRQDISSVCNILPRLPSDVHFIKVVKRYLESGGEKTNKMFMIRRAEVLNALRWLKKYNRDYTDVEIEESNLNWIENQQEQELPAHLIQIDENENSSNNPSLVDLGPSESQTLSGCDSGMEDINNVDSVLGILPSSLPDLPKEKDGAALNTLKTALEEHNNRNQTTLQFPYASPEPINEYEEGNGLFTQTFPWLFPGGLGDFGQFWDKNITVGKWARNLLYYKDGRFAKDKIWCFFALDFSTRKKNQQSGGFFIKTFFKEGPKSLNELKEEIENGNTSWIEQLSYYSQRVIGSPGYWRAKRSEVYSWINHHIEAGHGPPTFFITLSCAEYMWPDIKRLLKNRFEVGGMGDIDLNKSFVQTVNEYTLVVQEYFQERVRIWLETIGAKVFHIKYYWLRFEFAPSRGQIHAHMLALHNNPNVMQLYYNYSHDKEKQEEFLYKYMTEELGMTAWVPENFSNISVNKNNHPSKFFYQDNIQQPDDDFLCCLQTLQNHKCSAFCMRKQHVQ